MFVGYRLEAFARVLRASVRSKGKVRRVAEIVWGRHGGTTVLRQMMAGNKVPSVEVLLKLCVAIGRSPNEMLGWEE
jgi:hypothetical protein